MNFKADGGSRTRTSTVPQSSRVGSIRLSYTDSIADPRGLILSDQLYSFTGRNYCDGRSRTCNLHRSWAQAWRSIRFELRRNKSPAVWASLGACGESARLIRKALKFVNQKINVRPVKIEWHSRAPLRTLFCIVAIIPDIKRRINPFCCAECTARRVLLVRLVLSPF